MELVELGRLGIIGFFLALVGLIVFVMRLYSRLAENHIQDSHEVIKENTKATVELTGAVKEMKDIIIRQK